MKLFLFFVVNSPLKLYLTPIDNHNEIIMLKKFLNLPRKTITFRCDNLGNSNQECIFIAATAVKYVRICIASYCLTLVFDQAHRDSNGCGAL